MLPCLWVVLSSTEMYFYDARDTLLALSIGWCLLRKKDRMLCPFCEECFTFLFAISKSSARQKWKTKHTHFFFSECLILSHLELTASEWKHLDTTVQKYLDSILMLLLRIQGLLSDLQYIHYYGKSILQSNLNNAKSIYVNGYAIIMRIYNSYDCHKFD